jgi:hypothetical protein
MSRSFTPGFLSNPSHWWARAEAARAKAGTSQDPDAKQKLLRVALEYERLAVRAEDLQKDDPAR